MLLGRKDRNFVDHYTESSRKGILVTGVIGLVIFNLYGVVDFFLSPTLYEKIWLIRIGVTAFSIGLLGLIGTPFGKGHLRALILTTALSISLSVIAIWGFVYPTKLPKEITGITVTMLFCMAGLRLLMTETIGYAVIMATAFFGLVSRREVDASTLASYFVSIPLVIAIGIAVSYLTEMYARKSFEDELMIALEREKSESLLKKTFPLEIANQLKVSPGIIAKREDEATVLFCDIIGFTEACTLMPPEELILALNSFFSALDRLTRDHQCEKIKTIGDAYMAVCGVPNSDKAHAERIVNLAIAIAGVASSMTLNSVPIRVRIGVHTGPVVAGVIGESRFAYDLWGDTVNIASRMESSAPEGKIQITEATKAAIGDRYVLEKRPQVTIKGKGLMDTWLVLAKKPDFQTSDVTSAHIAA